MLSTGFSDFFRNFFSFYNVSKSMLLEHGRPDTLTPLGGWAVSAQGRVNTSDTKFRKKTEIS